VEIHHQASGNGRPHVVKRTVDGLYQDIVVVNRFSCWPAVVDSRPSWALSSGRLAASRATACAPRGARRARSECSIPVV